MHGSSISRKPIGRKPVGPSVRPVDVPPRDPASPAPLSAAARPQALQLTPVSPSQHPQWQYSSLTATPTRLPTPTPIPTPTPTPGQLRRTITTASVQSLPSDYMYSRRTSLASSVTPISPLTAVTTPECFEPGPSTLGAAVKTCVSCKQAAIAQNVSIYTCLVCSTAHNATNVCVWCYTTGAAAPAHPHDASFFVTDSDLRIQGPTGGIPPHLWTVRKNASGRLWYEHVPTGFRTHVQPLTGAVSDVQGASGLPAGWQELKTPDNKVYYLHAATGNSSWTRPGNTLPAGWKMVRTPDGVPFYAHDALQLSTWDRPGEPPKAKTPAGGAPAGAAAPSHRVKSGKGSISASDIATAASVATNVAKLSAASDLSPSGILTATVAAAKLTGLGVKIAGKKMGKLGKGKRLSSAASLVGAAARIAGDDDGDFEEGGEIEEVEEVNEAEQTEYATETMTVYTETDPAQGGGAFSQQEPYGAPQQQFASEQYAGQEYQYPPSTAEPPPQAAPAQVSPEQPEYVYTPGLGDTPVQPPQREFYTSQPPLDPEQTSYYYPEQPADPYPPSTVGPPAPIPPPQEPTVQQPPVVINNVNVTVEETVVNDVNVENTQIIQNTEVTQNNTDMTQNNTDVTQNSQNTGYYTGVIQTPPVNIAQVQYPDTSTVPGPPFPPPIDPAPCQYPDTSMGAGQSGGEVPPFVFEPILAGPMMVNPPAEQNGVVFAPTYV